MWENIRRFFLRTKGLKPKLNSVHVDKLKTFPTDLSNLSNVVDNDVIKKGVYDKVVAKVNPIDTKICSTIGLVIKARYDTDN